MSNNYFQFKQFTIYQDLCAMKVTTDSCLFGAWVAETIGNRQLTNGLVLDIGTGTGLLPLMLAQKNNAFTIDAIEIDSEATQQAKENIATSPWKDRINIINADIRKYVPTVKYDYIICNPPFYENELRSPDPKKNIAQHEGFQLHELLDWIKENLTVKGQFFVLLPNKRNKEVRDLLLKQEMDVLQMTFVRQSVNHGYFRIMLNGKLKTNKQETMIDEIAIRNDQQQYSTEFTSLLKDYYLHL